MVAGSKNPTFASFESGVNVVSVGVYLGSYKNNLKKFKTNKNSY